jgi:hypothetical protein
MSRPVTTRRAVVRGTWFPGDRATLADLEARGVYARFVIGRPAPSGGASGADQPDPAAATEAALAAEAAAHGDIMRVPSVEAYDALLLKVLAYYRVALRSVNASFYVKTDDDVYARLDRVPALSAQWAADGAGYVGCLFLGGDMFRDPASAYYEPFGALIAGRKYFGYMSGGFYAASHQAAGWLAARPDDQVRPLGCTDDCSIGLQMLGLPVRVVEDWRVCTYGCQPTSVGEFVFVFVFWCVLVGEWGEAEERAESVGMDGRGGDGTVLHNPHTTPFSDALPTHSPTLPVVTDACNGLCDPEATIPRLHAQANCTGGGSGAAAIGPLWAPQNQRFVAKADADAMGCTVLQGGMLDRSACRRQAQE